MADTISLNNEVYHIGEDGLPCLIHYAPKTGGSYFSVAMVADLFLRGSKILFLTAYPMAKDNFLLMAPCILRRYNFDELVKSQKSEVFVIPAKAGIQCFQ